MRSRILALPALGRARTVSAYAAVRGEIPVERVLDDLWQAGKVVALPRLAADQLALHAVSPGTRLVKSRLAVLEPDSAAPRLETASVDLFLVPGLLFDRSGRRLGRGGGHFDRLLARARPAAMRVGVCHATRVVDGLPEDPWDIRMHLVVTTTEVIVPVGGADR